MKIEVINFIGTVAVIIVVTICGIFFLKFGIDNGKHLEDKGYRLCMNGIVEETLSQNAMNACLEKYGIEFK